MLVWGGDVSGVPIGNGAAYDPAANAWTALSATSAPVARFDHAAVWTGQEMLIVGGTTGVAELASGSACDPTTGMWRQLSTGNLQARTEATASWTGTELLVFGGRAQSQCLSALQRLVPQPAWYFYRKL
jgi:N-acetylneuraminic acid mutarotase